MKLNLRQATLNKIRQLATYLYYGTSFNVVIIEIVKQKLTLLVSFVVFLEEAITLPSKIITQPTGTSRAFKPASALKVKKKN